VEELHFLKHTIDHAHVEVHMFIEAGAETVDKGDRTNVQGALSAVCAPGLWVCRVCAMPRKKMRSIMLSTAPSRYMK
jgi:hypothetical protein